MTLAEFKALKTLETQRVRILFTDGQEVIARLFSVTTDLDESQHLIYDRVEWSALPHPCFASAPHALGETLICCSVLDC